MPRPDLAEFLLARYAETEANAVNIHDTFACDSIPCNCGVPEAIRAGCEANRQIVAVHHGGGEHECWEMHRGVYGPGWPEGSYAVEGQPWAHPSLEGSEIHPGPCETLQLLALPYAGHPDYRQEWKP